MCITVGVKLEVIGVILLGQPLKNKNNKKKRNEETKKRKSIQNNA